MRIDELRQERGGRSILIRCPERTDAAAMLAGLEKICGETEFLLRGAGELSFTVMEEEDFISAVNDSPRDLMLHCFVDGEFAGNCSFTGLTPARRAHRADFGIALLQKYTGMGLGQLLTERAILGARQAGYSQLELEVSAENTRAIALYQKLGFREYGRFPNGLRYSDGRCADLLWMMLRL